MPKDRSKRPPRVSWAAGQRIVTPNSSFRRRPTSTPSKAWRFTQGRRHSRRSIDYSDVGEDTLCHDEADGGSEDELDSEQYFFPWDDETTMFSDLIDDVPEESKDSKVESLVNRLQPSFDAHGRALKKEIANTFVPTVNNVRILHHVLDDKVDVAYEKGVVDLNDACKGLEAMAIKEQDELKDACERFKVGLGPIFEFIVQDINSKFKRNIEHLFGRLKAAYSRREQLLADYERAVDAIVEPILEKLKALPARTERTITHLEKHAINLNQNDGAAVTTMDIKGLFSKVS